MNEPISTLILPVENQTRELDAKLLLACAAAEREAAGVPVDPKVYTGLYFIRCRPELT